jgi:CheY-like chemotaxis protein
MNFHPVSIRYCPTGGYDPPTLIVRFMYCLGWFGNLILQFYPMKPRGANRKGIDPSLMEGRVVRSPPTRLAASKSKGARRGCILLVEDSEDDALCLKCALRKAGITMPVKVIEDGAVALSYLQGDSSFADRKRYPLPSIVILDLYLPNKNGFEILKWLRSQPQFSQTFVAVLTTPGKIEDIARAYRLGANSFLTTPWRPEDIQNLAQGFPSHWVISAPRDESRSTAELTPPKKTLNAPPPLPPPRKRTPKSSHEPAK